jgi:hypothetical protein
VVIKTLEIVMKKYEILSIEPSDLPHHWVVSFKFDGGKIEKEAIEALDSYEVFVKFRNQMIKQAKSKSKKEMGDGEQ